MLISSCIYQEPCSPTGSVHKDTHYQGRAEQQGFGYPSAIPWHGEGLSMFGLSIPTRGFNAQQQQQQQYQNTKCCVSLVWAENNRKPSKWERSHRAIEKGCRGYAMQQSELWVCGPKWQIYAERGGRE